MKTITKVWLIIATSLSLLGFVLFVGVMTTLDWDFMKLSTVKYETSIYKINEAFNNISIDTATADIVFEISEDNELRVECHEEETAKHSVTVNDGTLIVELIDNKSVYNFIGLNFDSPTVTIHLPKSEYTNLLINGDTSDVEIPYDFMFHNVEISLSTGDVDFCASVSNVLKINTSTGDICVENISVGKLDLSVSTGKTYLTNIVCQNVISSGNTGDIIFNNVTATEKFSVERSTGDVKFDGSDANEIFVKTDTGDVTGSLNTDKIFITHTDTGNVDVPKTVNGGICEITTDTGDIELDIQ